MSQKKKVADSGAGKRLQKNGVGIQTKIAIALGFIAVAKGAVEVAQMLVSLVVSLI